MSRIIHLLFVTGLWLSSTIASGQALSERASDVGRPSEASADVDQVEELIVKRTNGFRQKHELEPVKPNSELDDAAEYFARFMARTDKYGHQADGQTPSERAEEHGYDYCIVSENIAMQYSSLGFPTQKLARRFVRGWKESPGHRKNMLDPDVIDTGVAVAQSESTGRYYAVQMFGRPQSRQFEFQIVNRSGSGVVYTLSDQKFELPPRYTRTHQRCRSVELVFPREQQEDQVFQPEGGDDFEIVDAENGAYIVEKRTGESR